LRALPKEGFAQGGVMLDSYLALALALALAFF